MNLTFLQIEQFRIEMCEFIGISENFKIPEILDIIHHTFR